MLHLTRHLLLDQSTSYIILSTDHISLIRQHIPYTLQKICDRVVIRMFYGLHQKVIVHAMFYDNI